MISTTSLLYWAILLGMGIFAWDTVRSKNKVSHRWMTAFFFALWVPLIGLIHATTLGHHKPSWLAWRMQDGKYRVRDVKIIPNKRIYAYIDTTGEPVAMEFPWSQALAQELQDALRESRRHRRRGAIMDFSHSWEIDRGPKFYPLPQLRAMPPKPHEDPPTVLERGT